jgi:hypothetical protein
MDSNTSERSTVGIGSRATPSRSVTSVFCLPSRKYLSGCLAYVSATPEKRLVCSRPPCPACRSRWRDCMPMRCLGAPKHAGSLPTLPRSLTRGHASRPPRGRTSPTASVSRWRVGDRAWSVESVVAPPLPAPTEATRWLSLSSPPGYGRQDDAAQPQALYPRLARRGALVVDDSGHWQGGQGARRGRRHEQCDLHVLLQRIDYTARLLVKP